MRNNLRELPSSLFLQVLIRFSLNDWLINDNQFCSTKQRQKSNGRQLGRKKSQEEDTVGKSEKK